MITKKEAESLTYRQIIYNLSHIGSDKRPIRARVNGKCKTWKTRPLDFKLPMRLDLYHCFYLTQRNHADWTTSEKEAKKTAGMSYFSQFVRL